MSPAEESLALRAPSPASSLVEEVREFIESLRRELPQIFPAAPAGKSSRARRIPYRGGEIELRMSRDPACARARIEEEEGSLLIVRPLNDDTEPREMLREWYREKAGRIFEERTAHWGRLLGVSFVRIQIKDQRTLWGSCSAEGSLNFNWRVVMAPPEVLDYLVVHELAHLLEMNHSRGFWRHVAVHCPDFKKHRAWLRDHSRELKSRLRR